MFSNHLRSCWIACFEQKTRSCCEMRSTVRLPGLRYAVLQILVVLASVAWISSTVPCQGQATTGSIAGTVTDATGAVVPSAVVTATNTSTGVASRTTADSSGHYNFLSLPAGSYTVAATQTGFDTTTLTGITLSLYQRLTQNIILKVGTQEQSVTVQASATLVDTTSASLGTTVNKAMILDMPLDLREVNALALLVPGTVNTTGRSLATGAANGSGFNDVGYSGSGGGSGGNLL
jgi:Carboxypeptidase regulatory-like domain